MSDVINDFLSGGAVPSPTTMPTSAPVQAAAAPKAASLPQQATQDVPAQAAPQPAPAPADGGDDVFNAVLQSNTPSQPLVAKGNTAEFPSPDSPLSIAQRAVLGWAQTPEDQMRWLKAHFADAKMMPTPEGGVAFSVKDTDGKWKEADPDFHWLHPIDTASQIPGAIASFTGQYGLRTAGAALGAAGLLALAPEALGAGLAGLAISAVGAGLGSAAAEGVDMAGRAAVGATPAMYKDADAVKKQLILSSLFGMEQEVGGKLLGKAFSKAAEFLGDMIAKVSGQPEGRAAVKKLLSMTDLKPIAIEARLQDSARNGVFDKIAAKDAGLPMEQQALPRMESQIFENRVLAPMQDIVRREGLEFAALRANPGVKAASVDISEPLVDAVNLLKKEGYITDSLKIDTQRELYDGDMGAMNRILSRASKNKELSYDEARMFAQDLGVVLNKGGTNDTVRLALTQLKNGVHQSIIDALPEDAALQYGKVMEKYGPAKDKLFELNKIDSSDQKRITFINKLMSPDNNGAQELVRSLSDAGVPLDGVYDLIRIQGSKTAQDWFSKTKKIAGIPFPLGGKVGAIATDAAAKNANIVPYIGKAFDTLRQLAPASRATILRNPQAIDLIAKTVASGVAGEKQAKEQLLQQSGAQQ